MKKLMNKHIYLFFLFFALISCTRPLSKGFTLQKFEISNHKLDSIINRFTINLDVLYKQKISGGRKDTIMVLDLQLIDSIPQFWFTFQDAKQIREFYIFYQNRRVVGYAVKNNHIVILLSNIDSQYEFEEIYSQFIRPTKEEKYFDFIYLPNNQYRVDSEKLVGENGKPIYISKWPDRFRYDIYDIPYCRFKYINNRFINYMPL